jgi:hypothetical protein
MPLFKGEKQPKQISKVKQLEICPDGDMEIALSCPNNVTYRYQVSSLQLCACSPVCRAMLGPKSSFSEAVALQNHRLLQSENPGVDGLYNLKVEDHDPTALVAVLNIIHGHPEKLPDEIPFEGLVQVALICDFYDCAAAMRPWDKTWMEQWQNDAKTPGFESWLFIARVFKEEDVFQTLSRKLVTNSIVEDGEFKVVVSKEPIARVVKRLDNYIPQGMEGSNLSDGAILTVL